MDCLDSNGGEPEDVVAVAGSGLASQDRAMQVLADVYKAPAREKVADRIVKCLDLATAALGAKTPVLDMADLFAAVLKDTVSN